MHHLYAILLPDRNSINWIEYYLELLPQAALTSINPDAEMAEFTELRFNLEGRLRRVETLLRELRSTLR